MKWNAFMRVSSRSKAGGVSLIELMISVVLGLLVVGAAIGIFISNKQAFRVADNLSRVQENARVGYELMARELRQAGGSPCSRNVPIVNVLQPNSIWGTGWGEGVHGYIGTEAFGGATFGTAAASRVNGTDAIELRSGAPGEVTVEEHKPASAQFKVNTVNHGLQDGDIAIVCDFVQASIFQITGAQSGINVTVVHNPAQGTGVANPGNCS
jgi:type IV pilus assembly protein PilW